MEAFYTIFTFPEFSQKGLTPRFHGTRFLRLEIYPKEMAKLHFLRIFEKATFFKAKREHNIHTLFSKTAPLPSRICI